MYLNPWKPSSSKKQRDSLMHLALPVALSWDFSNTFWEISASREPGQVEETALFVTMFLPTNATLHYLQNSFARSWTTQISLLLTPCRLLAINFIYGGGGGFRIYHIRTWWNIYWRGKIKGLGKQTFKGCLEILFLHVLQENKTK